MGNKKAFFYGLFMDPALLEDQQLHPKNILIARLPDYKLLLGKRATMIKNSGSEVWGICMDLTEGELKSLYSAESVSDYIPIDVTVCSKGSKMLSSRTYILPTDYKLAPPVNSDYARKLLTACKKLLLPDHYCLKIQKQISLIENGEYKT